MGFYSREIAPIPEANRRDPVMIRCTTFCLISFYIKINSVLRILITHIIMVAASKVGATSLAIKYEPLKCDCKITKRNEVWGATSRFEVESSSDIFLRRRNDKKRIARCQKIFHVPNEDTIEICRDLLHLWSRLYRQPNLVDTQLGVKHLL